MRYVNRVQRVWVTSAPHDVRLAGQATWFASPACDENVQLCLWTSKALSWWQQSTKKSTGRFKIWGLPCDCSGRTLVTVQVSCDPAAHPAAEAEHPTWPLHSHARGLSKIVGKTSKSTHLGSCVWGLFSLLAGFLGSPLCSLRTFLFPHGFAT